MCYVMRVACLCVFVLLRLFVSVVGLRLCSAAFINFDGLGRLPLRFCLRCKVTIVAQQSDNHTFVCGSSE